MSKTIFRRSLIAASLLAFLCVAFQLMITADATQIGELSINKQGNEFVLKTDALGEIRRTTRETSDAKLISLPDSPSQVVVWNEEGENGNKQPFYAVSLDGKTVSRVTETSYDLMLRYGKFDPLVSRPQTPDGLTARSDAEDAVYIVQFVTQPLDTYRSAISALGGKSYIYLPSHAQLVRMNAETKAKVEGLPFVRWVGRYEPAYKLEEVLLEGLMNDGLQTARYNIMVIERGAAMQNDLAGDVRAVGGKVDSIVPEGLRMEATLSPQQLLAIANNNDVLFIDRWSAPEADMDVVRETGGANFIETTLGFKGQGVRAEVMDGGLLTTHTDFQTGGAPITHGAVNVDSHGTATYGINFGRGTTNPLGKGMLPEAQGIIAGYPALTNRYTHTAELKQDPYKAVYQSNSWGNAQTTAYTTISAEMDDILFKEDFLLLNSQSNTGNQTSRPQAWSKNVVSIGGISHFNNTNPDDDRWTSASIGPATDGRLKPELAHYYDNIFTTTSTSTTAYTSGFNGTSAATPIVAGHFGIFFQMWHEDVFGSTPGATVFDARPHMTTAKAVMINTASQWDMAIANRRREQQGFGRPDLRNLYNLRNKMLIVNETDVLTNLQSKSYSVTVPSGSADPLKVTMTYADPMGSPSATRHRINDLTLKVTAPDGTIYWGNNGLGIGGGMWSTAGGVANIVDTVENVFIQTPAAGTWTVEVIASELVQDARVETPGVTDADYALVVSGIQQSAGNSGTPFDYTGDAKADVSVFRSGTWYVSNSANNQLAAVPFGQSGDRIVPEDYDGDGKYDVAVFRGGNWYILQSSNNAFRATLFGVGTDTPVPGDYDGDNKADTAVFRGGNWYVMQSSNNQFRATLFGVGSDKPIVGDFDGDNKNDLTVFRDGTWYRLNSSNNQFVAIGFGQAGDRPVAADYDGDGKYDVAVFRSGNWYILNSANNAFRAVLFGVGSDTPVAADYDGDNKADVSVFRSGTWYRTNSTNNAFVAIPFGQAGDVPTESAYVP
jgi:serine protease AprX